MLAGPHLARVPGSAPAVRAEAVRPQGCRQARVVSVGCRRLQPVACASAQAGRPEHHPGSLAGVSAVLASLARGAPPG